MHSLFTFFSSAEDVLDAKKAHDGSVPCKHCMNVMSNSTAPPAFDDFDDLDSDPSQIGPRTISLSPSVTAPAFEEDDVINDDFYSAIADNSHAMLLFLVEENPTVDFIHSTFKNGDSVLYHAIKKRSYDCLEYLLESGASPNQQDAHGDTAMIIAARRNDVRAIELLLKYGGDAHMENNDEESCLSIADELDYSKIVKLLPALPAVAANTADEAPTFAALSAPNTGNKRTSIGHRGTTLRTHQFAEDILGSMEIDFGTRNEDYLQQMNTTRLGDVAEDIFTEVESESIRKKQSLIPLSGWLNKKQSSSLLNQWSKKYVVVHEKGYILWNNFERSVGKAGITEDERHRWDKVIPLSRIQEVSSIKKGKSGRKFKIKLKKQKRVYVFKAQSKKWRDKWVENLNAYIELDAQSALIKKTSTVY